jgi:hypothetical protein
MRKTKSGKIIFLVKYIPKILCQAQPKYFKDILTDKGLLDKNI